MSASSASSLLLSALHRDSSLQHSLVPFLSIADIRSLHAICRAWTRALDDPTGAAGGNDRPLVRVCAYTQLDVLLRSRWVLPLISALAVSFHPDCAVSFPRMPKPIVVTGMSPEDVASEGPDSHATAASQLWAWRKLLQSLPRFPRLRSLQVSFIEGDDIAVDRGEIQACFNVIGRRLQSLHLCSPDDDRRKPSAQPTLSVLSAVFPCLPHLHTLIVDDSQSWHSDLDPSLYLALPSLTRLSTANRFEVDTPLAAYDALARCVKLTDLHYSFQQSWKAASAMGGVHWRVRHDRRTKHFRETLGLFISTRVPLQSQGEVEPLRVIRLDGVEMTEDLFGELSRVPSLTELHPSHWDPQISEESWTAGFAGLPNLDRLWLGGNIYSAFEQADSVAPFTALRACRSLRRLELTLMVLTADSLGALADHLVALESLHIERMRVGSLTALGRFPRLTSLTLRMFGFVDGSTHQLPPMPALTRLSVDNTVCGLMSVSTATQLHAALAQRMPMLRPEGVVVDWF